eukprot:CAMPEP_0206462206 /NCGR_PEP_ID=MMETSP0324_2-20121206/25847_1 /ASSEMBLY_ACC=CAM_ASM_000836 /TAXON_ID=2866 /ORGANISM="Crypthecodinium cohnii, Strain Seligo" /LENGTH=771 /DNA_ID=CAMNT_0053934331 /DNA_START=52 /DNA_END=2367 /DNA_ORIENTATION=+
MKPKTMYLLAYNAGCGLGWLYCIVRAAQLLAAGASIGDIWEGVGQVLMISQTAMLLEIFHSLFGLVPSPVVTVAIQVSSRIFIVWGHTYWAHECQKHWSLLLIIFSWGITEVVRYLFYFTALLGLSPYPVFFLRYSMFIVLYPSGISGEIFQTLVAMGSHWKFACPLWYRLSLLVLLTYIPLGPFMILNMLGNRKRSFKKRNASEVKLAGVVWPKTKSGDRSSTSTNRAILAASAAASKAGQEASQKVLKEKNWRFGYGKHLENNVRDCLESKEQCIAMAKAGLASAQEQFKFVRGDKETSVAEAMKTYTDAAFESGEQSSQLEGEKPVLTLTYGAEKLGVPYYNYRKNRKNVISGLELRKQLDTWAEYGTLEPDVAEALKTLQGNQNEWLDLSGMHFVLLGAASAMGPFKFLLKHGATVVAVARSKALMKLLKEAQEMPGKVIFPVKKGADWKTPLAQGDCAALEKVIGCDLLTEAPEIATWICSVAPGKPLVVGNYTYLDGALHVQVAVACDCIMERVCKERKDTALAFLGTPTDVHVISSEAKVAMEKNYEEAPAWMKLLESIGLLQRNKAMEKNGIAFSNCIVSDQGPNYILAKRIQHWRAAVARTDGHTVSSNVSPSTATKSVTSNASFAAAYGGMHMFKPMEVAYEELSMSMMGALLIHDVRNPKSASHASNALDNPLCISAATSFHGGVWRCPYTVSTIGVPSAVRYYLVTFWHAILVGLLLTAATVQYVAFGTLPGPADAVVKMLAPLFSPFVALASILRVPL